MNHKNIFPIERMCKVLKVSSSSYYHWVKHPISKKQKRDNDLLIKIKAVHIKSKETYGSPRITKELNMEGTNVSQKTIARIMKENDIKSRAKRKYKVTTDSNHKYPISPNLLKRRFLTSDENQVWVSDITYIHTNNGWLYLTIILDLYDRKIIGWNMSDRMYTEQTIIPAWNMAVKNRPINSPLIFHSDRGIQYAANRFRKKIKAYPLVKQSMSRKGNCWDNAVAESFFKSLKVEAIYQYRFNTKNQAKIAVFEYIETWYNISRRHSHLENLTKKEFEFINQLKSVA